MKAGVQVREFWDMTPREIQMCFKAFLWQQKRERERDAWVVWHTAALSRMRQMPALSRLMGADKAQPLRGDELEQRKQEHADIVKRLGHG